MYSLLTYVNIYEASVKNARYRSVGQDQPPILTLFSPSAEYHGSDPRIRCKRNFITSAFQRIKIRGK